MTIVVMMMKMIMMVITIMKMAITGKLIAIREPTNLNMASNFELVSCRARGAGGMVREAQQGEIERVKDVLLQVATQP